MEHRRLISRRIVRTVAAALVAVVSLTVLTIACGPGPGNGGPAPTEGVDITVTVVGDGRVLSNAIDLSCTGTCTVTVPEGSEVTLAGLAGSGQVLAGWEGPCPMFGGSCAWTATEDTAVTATFAPHALRFDLRGDGEGSFQITGGGIDRECRDTCFVTIPTELPILQLGVQYRSEGSARTTLGPWTGACTEATDDTYCLVRVEGATTIGKTWRHPPLAENHDYTTNYPTPLTVGPPGVLTDVDDTEGDTHTASRVSGPANGALELAPDGSFTYTPDAGFAGTDTFTFRVRDAFGNTDDGTATVVVRPRLTLTKTGGGSVASDPEGIDCGMACDSDVAHFDVGTTVTLTATPADGNSFGAWSGGPCAGSDALTCQVTMSAPVTIGAAFGTAVYTLSAALAGTGNGNVTSTPGDIDLDAGQTSDQFDHGTTITLTATPATGSTFTSWTTGPCAGSASATCEVILADDTTATASFALNTYTLSAALAGTGNGNVTSTPGDIDLDAGQTSDQFDHGTEITLTATPEDALLDTFVEWDSGPCAGDDDPTCTFIIVGDDSATAVFATIASPD